MAAQRHFPAANPRRARRFGIPIRLSLSALGACIVIGMMIACLGSLPYTLGRAMPNEAPMAEGGREGAAQRHLPRRYEATSAEHALMPPTWASKRSDERQREQELYEKEGRSALSILGTDRLGRSMLVRCLAGGGISLTIGMLAAALAVGIGTFYGMIAGFCGGRIDAIMMRIVDVLFGLPYILLVVLVAVAADGLMRNAASPGAGDDGGGAAWLAANRDLFNLITLLVSIGGVSWLAMARVIRGQVLSLKQQPFMEACRAIGVPIHRQFFRHLLPNLLGPIIVYATMTVPTAILSESFLSFLGIGVQEPLPSWGNLAAAGLSELNTVRVRWWLLLWPCLFIAVTLLALNFVGEGLRERFDPKRRAMR